MELIQSLVGNGWDLRHFCPVVSATFGAIDWDAVPADDECPPELLQAEREREFVEALGREIEDDSESSSSTE